MYTDIPSALKVERAPEPSWLLIDSRTVHKGYGEVQKLLSRYPLAMAVLLCDDDPDPTMCADTAGISIWARKSGLHHLVPIIINSRPAA